MCSTTLLSMVRIKNSALADVKEITVVFVEKRNAQPKKAHPRTQKRFWMKALLMIAPEIGF